MTEQEFIELYDEKEAELKYKRRRLDAVTEYLLKLQDLLSERAAEMRKEQKDVEGLKKLTIKNLFYKIMSRMDEVTVKEEQEYFDAKMKYEELENSINLTQKDKQSIQSDIYGLERELRNLKENGRKQFAEIERKFAAVENELIKLKSDVKELGEAIVSGNGVCAAIDRAVEKLEKAKGWATYDMFSKGGIISHMAKYGNIDEAQDTIKEIGHLVDIFQLELKDVSVEFKYDFDNYGSTSRFVDYFFDNIFTDMNVRGNITDDISRLNTLKRNIESITYKLNSSRDIALKKISYMT